MSRSQLDFAMQFLRESVGRDGLADLPDRQLLERYIDRQEESAYATLLQRHGPMVLGVCRRVLRQSQDAEDAYQATFLLLARAASSIRKRDSLGGWLYGVAHRVQSSFVLEAPGNQRSKGTLRRSSQLWLRKTDQVRTQSRRQPGVNYDVSLTKNWLAFQSSCEHRSFSAIWKVGRKTKGPGSSVGLRVSSVAALNMGADGYVSC